MGQGLRKTLKKLVSDLVFQALNLDLRRDYLSLQLGNLKLCRVGMEDSGGKVGR